MKMKRALVMMSAVSVFLMVARTQATIIGTPVNVNPGTGGNTVRNSDGLDGVAGGWLGTGTGQWDNRTSGLPSAGFGGDNLEGEPSTSVNTPELKLTITGLNPAHQNNLYVIYWTQDSTPGGSAALTPSPDDWHIDAGLSAGSLTTYNSANGTYTGTSIPVGNGNYLSQREVLLGQVTSVSFASVYVNGDLLSLASDDRTWLDAAAYEEIIPQVPEPSSVLLLLAGGLTVWRCRRCR